MIPAWLASAALVTSLLCMRQLGGLQALELATFDQLVRLQTDRGPDPRLLIVAITEEDIQAQQRWPLPDRVIAQTLAALQKHQPKAIGLDLYRDLPKEPGYQQLVTQLQAPNVIAITKIHDSESAGVPPPPSVPPERIGFNDFIIDADGVIRRNLMLISQPDGLTFYSFSLKLALLYLKERYQLQNSPSNPNLISWGKATFVPLEDHEGGYVNLDAQGYQILLDYRSPRRVARQVTLTQVLQGNLNPYWVKDKIVLIGTTAASSRDLFLTPYSPLERQNAKMPGVLVHAQMLSQLLSAVLEGRSLFWFWPEWLEILWIGSWAAIGGWLAWRMQHPAKLGLAIGGALVVLCGVAFGLFSLTGWVPLMPPALALAVAAITATAYKQLYSAFHDALTGLPNRALFVERVERAIRNARRYQRSQFAVFCLNLDRFKVINNSLGHIAGDTLLLAMVERLKTCVRATDTVARVGGDDFAILIENIQTVSHAAALAERIHQALVLPFTLNGQEVCMTVSIGIAVGGDSHYAVTSNERPDHLLRDAHTAMYRAKALGTGRYQVFTTAMHALAVERLQLEMDLRMGVKHLFSSLPEQSHSQTAIAVRPPQSEPETCFSKFLLHYQPLVSLSTGKIVGFEALVRWHHPDRGWVSPVKFIPVAEETGLIVPLGQWVLQAAAQQLRLWQQQFPLDPPLMLSVNLSGKQFAQADLIEQIQTVVEDSGVAASSLKLEITESVVMEDVEAAIAVLKQMKALKVKVAIDDFGTGYSSLSYLSRFPTDTLKVDKSFVGRMEAGEEEENIAIVRTIIMLAHALKMDVIAEGVETVQQLALLRSLGCEYGQGYFFAKPLPSEAATALLASDPQW
ncbi:MAG: EAL domain-containing protein [Actinomycetota bacterium]